MSKKTLEEKQVNTKAEIKPEEKAEVKTEEKVEAKAEEKAEATTEKVAKADSKVAETEAKTTEADAKATETETTAESTTAKAAETEALPGQKLFLKGRYVPVRLQLSVIALIPITIMGFLFITIGMYVLKRNTMSDMFSTLKGNAVMAADHFSSIEGVLRMEDGELYCGSHRMKDEYYFLEDQKKAFNVELSVFYGNSRVLTTLKDENGKQLIGTVLADTRIVSDVFKGRTVSKERNKIGKDQYLCVYVPISNNDRIVGMVGAAISMKGFYRTFRMFYIYIVTLTIVTGVVTTLFITLFSNQLVTRLHIIRKYLQSLVLKQTGDLEMDSLVHSRNDEISALGSYAASAGNSIEKLMGTDPLTGLFNRRAARQKLQQMWEESHKELTVFTIVIGDLDHFKNINDQYGHDVGDSVLVGISDIMKKYTSDDTSFACRWGGEEFLLGFTTARDEAYAITKNIAKDIKRKTFYSAKKNVIHMSMTFGIATFAGQESIDEVIKMADDNLYKGKNQGRDCIVC
ncbi:MAG: diguanylate cyclase [Lachnospiraceae bacterium]|nr:diguanylate cyclase [Lachnospiraceae bacterium]